MLVGELGRLLVPVPVLVPAMPELVLALWRGRKGLDPRLPHRR